MHVARRDGLMDATLASLLRACKDEPFDDARRLVLADWLEEHGEPDRAELVRLQVDPDRFWDEPEGAERLVRYQELLRANEERWLGPARQWYFRVQFAGGSVRVHASARELLDHPPSDLPADVGPWLEGLYLRSDSDPDDRDDVLASSILGSFSRLELCGDMRGPGGLGEDEVRLLTSNPALASVRTLRLPWNHVDRAAAEALARCERLSGLRMLDLYATPLRNDGAAALAQAPWLSGLTRVHLGDTGLTAPGYSAILGSPHLGRLTHLNFSSSRLDEKSARVIARSPRLASLTDLSLACSPATDPAVPRILADSPHLRPVRLDLSYSALGAATTLLARGGLLERVERLELSGKGLTEADCAALFDSGKLASLKSLRASGAVGDATCEILASSGCYERLLHASLNHAGIGPKGAAALGRARGLKSLASLSLDDNALGPAGVRGLAQGAGLPALRGLSLRGTRLQARGVQALVGSGMAARLLRLGLGTNRLTYCAAEVLALLGADARLVELELNFNRIGPDGLAALAGCPGLARLRVLKLIDNRVGDRGATAIARSPHLTRLSNLDLRTNGLTAAAFRTLLDWPRRRAMVGLWVDDLDASKEDAIDLSTAAD
jgi:uncharacterized protein (TIGR02996 family)